MITIMFLEEWLFFSFENPHGKAWEYYTNLSKGTGFY